MLCENCQLNEAELKVKVTSKNKTEEKMVCQTCAEGHHPWNQANEQPEYQEHQDNFEEAFVVKQILQHLATKHGINFQEVAFKEEKRCPSCHMTLKDIAHVGKFGCANCYATFKDDIIDIVRRVQGGQFEHVGKTPHSSHKKIALKRKIEEKNEYLKKLIEIQDFEEAAIVMSSRIRLARNLENHVHPLMYATENDGFRVINEVQDALPNFELMRLDQMDQQSKMKMVAKHLISPELIKQPAAAVLVNDDESLSVMINEEDHIRIQAMGTDTTLQALYNQASSIDDELDRSLDISYDEQLGYLTTCPTNIGTGMRASVMLHLPGLSIMKRMTRIAQTINRFGYTIRGIYGEGSQVYGHTYQVSNQLTLGKSELEIIETLTEVVNQIIHEEKQIRQKLDTYNQLETQDRVFRSLGILQNCRMITMEEASYRLSEVKLGIDLNYIELQNFKFNELMVAIQSPFLLDEEDDKSVKEKRADILREHIK